MWVRLIVDFIVVVGGGVGVDKREVNMVVVYFNASSKAISKNWNPKWAKRSEAAPLFSCKWDTCYFARAMLLRRRHTSTCVGMGRQQQYEDSRDKLHTLLLMSLRQKSKRKMRKKKRLQWPKRERRRRRKT